VDAQPNAAEPRLAAAIRLLGRPGFEAALHDWLRRCLAPDNMVVLAFRDAGPPQALYARADGPQVFAHLDSYLAGAYLLDPYHELNLRRVPAGVYRLRDVAPDRFRGSRYFRDYYRRTTIIDELAFVAYPAPGTVLNLCIGRDATSGQPFGGRDLAAADRLAPLVAALAESHWASHWAAHWADHAAASAAPPADLPGDLRATLERVRGLRISPRQAEVALLILRGHSSVSIGLRLGVSPQTVKVFRRQLYAGCGISTQAELFALLLPLLAQSDAS
jgi:DNA-binding CsgD family transcriptional regulator